MKRMALTGLAVLAGCAWSNSNSLYQARHLTRDAVQAERDKRPGEASQLWGVVVFKAESAYARSPRGARGAEALWLAGNAEAHNNNCGRAASYLERSFFSGPSAPWTEQLLLTLGRCQEANQGPTAASIYGLLLSHTADPAVRRQARLRQGHVLVLQQHWAEGAAALAGDDTLPARLDRATALAHLGRADEALADLGPMLAAADTSIRWITYIDLFAARNTAATDQLLSRLLSFPNVSDEQRSAWLLAAVQLSVDFDPDAADRRLNQLAGRPRGHAFTEGQMIRLQRKIVGAASIPALRGVLDSLRRGGELPEGSLEATRVAALQRSGQRLVSSSDSTRAGAPAGDLRMFALAEFARDTFASPRLAAWLLARLEREWPQSPYLPKALLTRAALEPDSAAALRERVQRYAANPYVAAAHGDRGGQARVAQLEDSLGRYIRTLRIGSPAAGRAAQERE
ncbi:MAG TPA: hypothetical protein VID74_03225 [Gemmatimonadales bacterium]